MKQYNQLISVIIPVYNTEKYLRSCLDSVLQQTYSNLEIILIDDGSTDLSGDICDEYAKKDERINVVHKMNEGVSKARNVGLDNAHGDYIGFVDSDDTICVDIFETLYTNLITNNCDISICGFMFCYPNEQYRSYESDILQVHNSNEAICNMLIGKYYAGHVCNKLFKSSSINKLKFDEHIYICEDLLFVTQVLLSCSKIVFHSIPLYNYNRRNESACHKPLDDRYYTAHSACLKIIDLLKNSNYISALEYAYASVLMCNINMLGKLYYDKPGRKKYCRKLKDNIRKHCNYNSISHLGKRLKCYAIVACISPYMYFFFRQISVDKHKERRESLLISGKYLPNQRYD